MILLELVDGFIFIPSCEQGADDLQTTLKAVEDQFGAYLHQVNGSIWVVVIILRGDDYDVDY